MKLKSKNTEITLSYALLCLTACCVIMGVMESFLWCAAAIALHEGGHLIMMKKYGYFPKRIKISLFEISINDGRRQLRTARENFFIIFFGPFVNFICFPASYLFGLFNCLPVMSLDGGQLMYLLLCRRHSPGAAERAVDIATFVCIFPLAALGFLVLLRSKNNFSLLFVCAYLAFSLIFKGNRYY